MKQGVKCSDLENQCSAKNRLHKQQIGQTKGETEKSNIPS